MIEEKTAASSGVSVPSLLLLPLVLTSFFLATHQSRPTEGDALVTSNSSAHDVYLQPFWDSLLSPPLLHDTLSHFLFPSVVGLTSFILTCFYFTHKDLTRDLRTKTQPDHFPTKEEILGAAVPQLVIYLTANTASWFLFPWHIELPVEAPSLARLVTEMTLCFIGGDFLIYAEHYIMHKIVFLRNNIHCVHHHYHYPFSWAGGWVHPVEDAVVIVTQITVPFLISAHPLSFWLFIFGWVAFLVEEHSGHDVWWSPHRLLPFGFGGGAVPHDIHHVRPLKNLGFVLCIWDHLFGTFEDPGLGPLDKVEESEQKVLAAGVVGRGQGPFVQQDFGMPACLLFFPLWLRQRVERNPTSLPVIDLPYGLW